MGLSGQGKLMELAHNIAIHKLKKLTHGSHEPMFWNNKVETKSGRTWHHPYVMDTWCDNGKPSWSCNEDNLLEALKSYPDV